MSIDMDVRDGVAEVTINRPERLNAMDREHYVRLSDAWQRVRDDPHIRVCIVRGAGNSAFSVGADLRSAEPVAGTIDEFWLTQKDQLLNRGLEMWKPVIAAVDGYCLGGGLTLLLATDVRLATPDASFGVPEVRRGILPGNGGTQRLLEQLPHAIAMEMLLAGSTIDATTAERWGLVNRIVPREGLMEEARRVAETIAANAPLAVQAAKEMAIRSRDVDRASGLRMEEAMQRLLRTTEDVVEGREAFAERREPKYKGR